MGIKHDWVTTIILGLALVFVGSTIHAHTLSIVLRYLDAPLYLAWSISTLVPVFLIVFPGGVFLFRTKHLKNGAITGLVGAVGIMALNAIDGRLLPTTGFVVEYVSLIVYSALAGQASKAWVERMG